MKNIVDRKYEEVSAFFENCDFCLKRNLAILGMARVSRVLEVFDKIDDLKEISALKDTISILLDSIENNTQINIDDVIQQCENLAETAEEKRTYPDITSTEQAICDCSYMLLECWFYLLQMDLSEDDGTDYARFVLFPAEILMEILTAINGNPNYDETQQRINENKAISREIALIDEYIRHSVDINNNLKSYVLNNMKADILEELL